MSAKTLGVLTGGGDCPGLNAVIRAVVKTAVNQHGMNVVGFADGFAGVVENRCEPMDYARVSGILTRGGTILGTSNRANPFEHYVGGEKRDMSHKAVATLESHGVDALIVIGGDGSLSIAERLHREYGLPVIGVPKTIDNDLSATDRTFGFDSAVAVATDAIDRLHTTAQSHSRVMIVELMGRYAGWIALHAGVAGGADVILLPEIPYRVDHVADACFERSVRGVNFSIIAISEGAREEGGEYAVAKTVAGSHDPVRLGGIGYALADKLEKQLGDTEVRVTVLGHLQRGGIPTAFDRVLATRFGALAAELAFRGEAGKMVALRGDDIVDVPIADAVSELKLVSPDDPLVATARALRTSFGDRPARIDAERAAL